MSQISRISDDHAVTKRGFPNAPSSLTQRNDPSDGNGLGSGPEVPSVSLTGLFILAVIWFLHQAKDFAVPLMLALLLHFLLMPVVRWLKRHHVIEPVAAAIILLAITGLVTITMYQLAAPAAQWLEKAPRALGVIESRLLPVKESVSQISEATDAINRVGQSDSSPAIRKVEVVPDRRAAVVSLLGKTMAGIGTTLLLLYFLLASGDLFARKLLSVLSRRKDRGSAIDILDGLERQMSQYLLQTLVIQGALGFTLWLALWALGMPNPGLWAAAAAILQIVPYIGGLLVLILIAVVAAVTFDHTWAIAGPVIAYLVLTILKGFIAPVLLGHRLVLNPVAVLVSLVFFGWMWGLAGTLLAVPLLACFKIMCDHIESWGWAGEFLA